MFETIEVWLHGSDQLATKFVCLRRLSDWKFDVQSADSFYFPASSNVVHESLARFVEQFLEEDPSERCECFPSLDEAIAANLIDFAYSTN